MMDYHVVYDDRADYRNQSHAHTDDMLFIPLDGFFAVNAEPMRSSRVIAQGTIWYVPHGQMHHVEASPGQRHFCYYTDVSRLNRHTQAPLPFYWPVSSLLHDLLRLRYHAHTVAAYGADHGLSTTAVDRMILQELARMTRHGVPADQDPTTTIAQIKQHIADHLDADLSSGAVAACFRLSERTLARWFKRTEGVTLGQYVLQARLQEGLRLLRSSSLPIADVQAAVGFASAAHFAYAMRRAFGRSPSALRLTAPVAENR